ncbi:MAG: hypothetical protein QW423_00630 [Candidatus Aenigmatarchaeota archaeon]
MIALNEIIQFDFLIFSLGFLLTELITNRLPKLRLFIVNGKKKIKIHHAYLGAIVTFFSALTGQVVLVNIGLGTMANDIVCHLRKTISKLLNNIK